MFKSATSATSTTSTFIVPSVILNYKNIFIIENQTTHISRHTQTQAEKGRSALEQHKKWISNCKISSSIRYNLHGCRYIIYICFVCLLSLAISWLHQLNVDDILLVSCVDILIEEKNCSHPSGGLIFYLMYLYINYPLYIDAILTFYFIARFHHVITVLSLGEIISKRNCLFGLPMSIAS